MAVDGLASQLGPLHKARAIYTVLLQEKTGDGGGREALSSSSSSSTSSITRGNAVITTSGNRQGVHSGSGSNGSNSSMPSTSSAAPPSPSSPTFGVMYRELRNPVIEVFFRLAHGRAKTPGSALALVPVLLSNALGYFAHETVFLRTSILQSNTDEVNCAQSNGPVKSDRDHRSLTGLGALTGPELREKWTEFVDKLELFLMQHSSDFDQGRGSIHTTYMAYHHLVIIYLLFYAISLISNAYSCQLTNLTND